MLTPEQRAKIRQKEASFPDALKRNPLTNYFEGYFFVTLNTRGEAPILSTIAGRIGGSGDEAPHCVYSELGEKIRHTIDTIHTFHPHAEVITAEVMPEHLHILLCLHRNGNAHLGKIMSGFMGGCTHDYWDVLGIDWRRDHPTQGTGKRVTLNAPAFTKPDRDRDHTRSYRGPSLFVRGYNDVVPITPQEVQIKIEYIKHQAEKRLIQGDRHSCFRIVRQNHTRSWTPDVALNAVLADPLIARNPAKLAEARELLAQRLNDGLDYVGNKELLANAHKLPLICHRADASYFDQQREAVLAAARSGAVIVSAFISPKERKIMKQLMVEQHPFIQIMDNGFADRYKPAGKAFYACGENRLTQITCWSYLYQRESQISRPMCMVMNQLARIITQRTEDWWKTQPK